MRNDLPGIVCDGLQRLKKSPEYRGKLQDLAQVRQAIVARYAERLAAAGWLKRRMLYRQMAAELRAERRRLKPSPYALF